MSVVERRRSACLPLVAILLSGVALVSCDGPQPVEIPLNGGRLEGFYWQPNKHLSPSVLLLSAGGETKEAWVPLGTQLRQRGYGVLAVELPGSRDDALAAVRAAFEFLRLRKKVDAARIGLVGSGEAADVALGFAAREPLVRTMVLISPAQGEAERQALLRDYGFRAKWVAERPLEPAEIIGFLEQHL